MKKNLASLGITLSIIGPGIISGIVGNDVGAIATFSLVGAEFGLSLLWIVLPVTILLFLIQEMTARLGIVTGKGFSDLIREQFGLSISFWAMLSLFCANLMVTIAQFTGILIAFELLAVPKAIASTLLCVLLLFILLRGSYKKVEHILLLFASVYLSYIIAGIMISPDWSAVGKAVITPAFSWSADYVAILIAIIGTTIAPWMQFYQQATIVDKGLKKENLTIIRYDVAFGSIAAGIVAFFIILTAAFTLFANQLQFTDLQQAAQALIPAAGELAPFLFATGLLATAIMAILVIPLSTAYAITESFGWERGVDKTFREAPVFYLILGSFIALGLLIGFIPSVPYLAFIYLAQIINGMLLPITLILLLILVNKPSLMGEHKNTLAHNLVAGSFIIVTVLLSLYLVLAPILS